MMQAANSPAAIIKSAENVSKMDQKERIKHDHAGRLIYNSFQLF